MRSFQFGRPAQATADAAPFVGAVVGQAARTFLAGWLAWVIGNDIGVHIDFWPAVGAAFLVALLTTTIKEAWTR